MRYRRVTRHCASSVPSSGHLPEAVHCGHRVRERGCRLPPHSSGKTWLIRALKQLLGSKALVCAPTGVAADNIGGCTYHSKIPVPRSDVDRQDVRLRANSARLDKLVDDFDGVSYIIIDEMSMVGRRALGQIDELLRQAKGQTKAPFGGLSVILVGDHGRAPSRSHALSHPAPGAGSSVRLRARVALCRATTGQGRADL